MLGSGWEAVLRTLKRSHKLSGVNIPLEIRVNSSTVADKDGTGVNFRIDYHPHNIGPLNEKDGEK